MAYRGKIACHFPERGQANPNFDTVDIKFLPAGENTLCQIDKVYFLPAGRTVSSIDDLELIWELVNKTLVAGSQSVAIQYIPTSNVSVTDIGIFTASNDNTDAKIKVFHESGLCVAAYDGDVRVRNSELYGLSGTKRDGSIPQTLLYAGQKYFILYYVWGVYPAYYQNGESQSIGNKIYENNTAASQTTIYDISENAQVLKPSMFRGVLNNSEGIFGFSENSWFVWMGSTQTGMTQGQVYRRTAVGGGWTFSGIVGDPTGHHPITSTDLTAILAKPPHGDFIWYVDGVSGMNRGEIWGKPTNWVTPVLLDFSSISDEQEKTALVFYNLSSTSSVMVSSGLFWYTNYIGSTFKLKSGYSSAVSSLTPLSSKPAQAVEKTMYYLSQSASGDWQNAIFVYENGNYTKIEQSNIWSYLDNNGLSVTLEKIGNNSDLLEAVSNTKGDETFLNANTDNRKYYLKINGNEV